jgi:hypothetical protein
MYGTYNSFSCTLGIIMKSGNMYSLPCALLCCFSNYHVLPKARYNDQTTEKPIPVTGQSKTWVRLLGLVFRILPRAWMSVSCDLCVVD